MKPVVHCCIALAATLLLAANASALTFDVMGQNFPDDVSAAVTLTYDGTDTLTVEIENTSDDVVLALAVVTGFAFNVPAAVTGISAFTASGTLDDPDWHHFFPPSGPGNAPGGYLFEAGAGTGMNVAGGHPPSGFHIGVTATFTFQFSGDALALAALTMNDFVGEFTDGASGPADFGVRFQAVKIAPLGSTEPGSDFALHKVPAPGAGLLLMLGLPAALARRLR